MSASRELPQTHESVWNFNIRSNFPLLLRLNLAALLLLLPAGFIASLVASAINPSIEPFLGFLHPPGPVFLNIAAYLASASLVIVAHELIHGAFFWLAIRERPDFGLRGGYAFAAAPGWYISGGIYFWIGISPLLLITLAGFALLPVIPFWLVNAWVFGIVINFIGSLGDAYIIWHLLRRSPGLLVHDRGDKIEFFRPAEHSKY